MSAFRDLSPEQRKRLEEAAAWRLRLAREPSLERSAEYRAWSADPESLKAREAIGDAWSTVGVMDTTPEMLELRQQALTRLRRAGSNPWGTRKLRLRVAAAAALAGMVAAGVAYVRWYTPTFYETEIGERRIVGLPDGSRISMDSDTKIGVLYYQGGREITLERGRSRFEVAHDPSRPFVVTAGPEAVVAVGTSFDVERLQSTVLVTLLQGQVVIKNSAPATRSTTNATQEMSISLQPGEQLVVPRGVPPAIKSADLQVANAWQAGHLVFRDETLSDAVTRVNRYTARPVVIDASIAGIRISGVFNAGDIGSFVSAVTSYFPVQASTNGNNNVLLQPRSF